MIGATIDVKTTNVKNHGLYTQDVQPPLYLL